MARAKGLTKREISEIVASELEEKQKELELANRKFLRNLTLDLEKKTKKREEAMVLGFQDFIERADIMLRDIDLRLADLESNFKFGKDSEKLQKSIALIDREIKTSRERFSMMLSEFQGMRQHLSNVNYSVIESRLNKLELSYAHLFNIYNHVIRGNKG